MSYKYKNLKHVILHGILPGEIGEFDHPILGGGIELVQDKKEEIKKIKMTKDKSEDLVHEKTQGVDLI